jgi:hypothetical protein
MKAPDKKTETEFLQKLYAIEAYIASAEGISKNLHLQRLDDPSRLGSGLRRGRPARK